MTEDDLAVAGVIGEDGRQVVVAEELAEGEAPDVMIGETENADR